MLAQADDKAMNKAIFILKKMSADEKMREIARVREKALHDEASYMETARFEGEIIGEQRGRKAEKGYHFNKYTVIVKFHNPLPTGYFPIF